MKPIKSILSAAALSCAMSAPALADRYTPAYLHFLATEANIITEMSTFVEIASISAGMLSAVITMQDLGIVPRAVCPPIKDGKPNNFTVSFNMNQTLRKQNPYDFPDTDQGGAMYVYTAMVNAYPCR
jgi:hypothetical protein